MHSLHLLGMEAIFYYIIYVFMVLKFVFAYWNIFLLVIFCYSCKERNYSTVEMIGEYKEYVDRGLRISTQTGNVFSFQKDSILLINSKAMTHAKWYVKDGVVIVNWTELDTAGTPYIQHYKIKHSNRLEIDSVLFSDCTTNTIRNYKNLYYKRIN